MIISGSSKERSVVVDHNAFLKHDVGIKCFLTCGDDAVCSFGFVIECETLDVSDGFFATLVMLGNDFLICCLLYTSLYGQYRELAEKEPKVIFGGRLGEYKYYDMDAVIASALDMCERELA